METILANVYGLGFYNWTVALSKIFTLVDEIGKYWISESTFKTAGR